MDLKIRWYHIIRFLKNERLTNEGLATKEQIILIVEKLNLDEQLMVLWLSDKINPYISENSELGLKALKVS